MPMTTIAIAVENVDETNKSFGWNWRIKNGAIPVKTYSNVDYIIR